MENMYCVCLVFLVGFGRVPSSASASETLKIKENNFSFVEEFIQPAKFLADLSRSNSSDNSTLQKITDDFLKMINQTNSTRHFEPSVSVAISQDTESLPISDFDEESYDDNIVKKKFVVCLGFVVFVLGFFIMYRKTCKSGSHTDLTLPNIRRVDTPPPPPYYLFAPPSYEECMCGLIKSDSKFRNAVISVDWPISTDMSADTVTTSYDFIAKERANEKLLI